MLITVYITTIPITAAPHTGYGCIEPFLSRAGNISPPPLTAALMIFGFAGITGGRLFSELYDRCRTRFATAMVAGAAFQAEVIRWAARKDEAIATGWVGMAGGMIGPAAKDVRALRLARVMRRMDLGKRTG